MVTSWEGFSYQNTNPADPTIAVGPNHVIQMVNNADGGNIISSNILLDNLSMINGGGDPIVLYDQLANRWILTEFADGQNALVILVSETDDPTGAYHIYSFNTPFFPDYPKYGLWPNAYIITTNESDGQALYALDRAKLLTGDQSATIQRFTIPLFSTIGFQAATPVSLLGNNIDPVNYSLYKPTFLRLADDGWDGVAYDRLEYFSLNLDFNVPVNSSLEGPNFLATAPFDTELCGFTSFSCIEQPNSSTKLDPLREVLMNRIYFRQFEGYQALVCSHVTDVDANDLAGVRWYELRKYGSNLNWEIHQQGTYSPDDNNRWMSTITMDDFGNIALSYNISSSSIFPSQAVVSRMVCDDLGLMTSGETLLASGTAANLSNRFGDYSDMALDPVTGNFWITSMYNPGVLWSTKVSQINVAQNCEGIQLIGLAEEYVKCGEEDLQVSFYVEYLGMEADTFFIMINDTSDILGDVTFTPTFITQSDTISVNIVSDTILDISLTLVIDLFNDSTLVRDSFNVQLIDTLLEPLQLIAPNNTALSIGLVPTFSWHELDDIPVYRFLLAQDSFFTTLVVDSIVFDTVVLLSQQLNPLDTYYWKVKTSDLCDSDIISPIFSFNTIYDTIQCFSLLSEQDVVIPNTQGRVSSIISFPFDAKIVDVNIINMAIDHTFVSDLYIELISPAEIKVPLLSFVCDNEDNINLGFDVDATRPNFTVPCPPTDGLVYQAVGELDLYNNMSAQGDWTLSIFDAFDADGGLLKEWSLEICVNTIESLCRDTLYLYRDPLAYDTNIALKNIISSGRASGDKIFQFIAGEEINLIENFEVTFGTQVEAIIQQNIECNHPDLKE